MRASDKVRNGLEESKNKMRWIEMEMVRKTLVGSRVLRTGMNH